MKTDTEKKPSRKFNSGPLFQTEKKIRREHLPLTNNEIQPKNRPCLRVLDGKHGRWDEILRDILNGKQNRKKVDTNTEERDDDDDDEEMPEATGRQTYYTSERNGRYAPIQTNPDDEVKRIHTDGETEKYRVRILKVKSGVHTETYINRIDTVVYHIQETFGLKEINNNYTSMFVIGTTWNRHKGTPQSEAGEFHF